MSDLDQQLREHYAGQSLDPAAISRLKATIASTAKARRPFYWVRYAAAAVLVGLFAGLLSWRAYHIEHVSTLASAQMVQQHREPFAAEFIAEDFGGLKGKMNQLAFAPIEPARCTQEEYRVVGARYASLAGEKVAQIRLAYVYGPAVTLYEMKPNQFPGLREGKTNIDGVPLTVWHEGGLTMALAGEITQ